MSTIMLSGSLFSLCRPLLIRGALALLFLSGLVSAESPISGGPNCHHSIVAGTDAHIHLKNYMGSVEIRNGDKDKILITADVSDDCVKIDKSGSMVGIHA